MFCPIARAVSIGNATLDAATFADTAGTLDVTSTATINLGSAAALAFADSSAIDWTGGTLNLTGTFVSGASLRFGTSNTGLTATQLAKFSGDRLEFLRPQCQRLPNRLRRQRRQHSADPGWQRHRR